MSTEPAKPASEPNAPTTGIFFFLFQATLLQLGIFVIVKYMHHRDDLVEHRTREASFGAQCTNHSANSMCPITKLVQSIVN